MVKKLFEKINDLKEWFTRRKLAQKLSIDNARRVEQAEHGNTMLLNKSKEIDEIYSRNSSERIEGDEHFLVDALPTLHEYSISVFPSKSDSTDSRTTIVSEYIAGIKNPDNPQQQAYTERITRVHDDPNLSANRLQDVRRLLGELGNRQTLDHFEEAYNSYYDNEDRVLEKKAAASLMAVFLNNFQEDLFNFAKRSPEEHITWTMMSARLVKAKIGEEEEVLLEQESVRNSLLKQLSFISEDQESALQPSLESIWTQLLDHIYIILTLTEVHKS